MSKKLLAIILALIIALSVVAVPVAAAGIALPNTSLENVLYMIIDKLLSWLLSYFNMYWPGYEGAWTGIDEYDSADFYAGQEEFDTTFDGSNEWSVGYARESLLDGLDIMGGDYYMAGSLEPIAGRVPTKIVDDQRVRVYAISDGDDTDGDGVTDKVVHAVIDGFGFSRGDVNIIRERLAEFAEANDVISINVSVLHQHSCIDTLGMNVPLAPALIYNTSNAAVGGISDKIIEKNQQFMENLFAKTVYAIKRAVKTMKTGDLYYGTVDANEFIHDKREPIAIDEMVHRLRFVPEDGSAETWIIEAGFHVISLGAGGSELTGDVPFYVEKHLNEELGVNVVYVQGAELAISKGDVEACTLCGGTGVPTDAVDEETGKRLYECTECGENFVPADEDRYQSMETFSTLYAKKICTIDNEIKLDPVLNIAHREVVLDVTNEILTLATREGILNAVIVKNGNDYQMITEIGYMRLGNEVAIFICPGEFDPALIYGGPESGSASWTGTTWEYTGPDGEKTAAPLKDYLDVDNVMVFGLCNDQAGYVLRDNEYHSIIDNNEEVNIVATNAGSVFSAEFAKMVCDFAA